MLNAKQLMILITLFSLAIGVAGCAKKLPIELTTELEKITGPDINGKDFRIGIIPLIDSKNGQAKFFMHEENFFKGFFDKPLPASEIVDITTVSVVGVSGIKVNEIEYKFCNYINVASIKNDPINSLICKNNEFRHAGLPVLEEASEIPIIPKELAGRIAKVGGIEDLGFLVLTDIVTGETKLLRQENYVSLPVSLPQQIDTLISSNSWNVTTYWKNPCCQCKDGECTCAKWVPKCLR